MSSVKAKRVPFFDQEDYERIIEYYEESGRFENALEVAEQALSQYPYSAILLLKKAQVMFEMKQIDTALELLDKAAIFDNSEVGIYLLRAEIYTFQSGFKEGVDLVEPLLETAEGENLPEFFRKLGECTKTGKNTTKSTIAWWHVCASIHPTKKH